MTRLVCNKIFTQDLNLKFTGAILKIGLELQKEMGSTNIILKFTHNHLDSCNKYSNILTFIKEFYVKFPYLISLK